MYCIVSWDISAVNPRWSAIDEKMRECISSYAWFRPVNTFYVIPISNTNQVTTILNALQNVAKQTNETVHFVISPAYQSAGGWDGWLPEDHWPKLKAITG